MRDRALCQCQLTLLKHFHIAVFILVLLVTYIRSSELLALKKKDPGIIESTSSWSCTKHVAVEPASIGYKIAELCKKCKDEVGGECSTVSQSMKKKQTDYHPLPRPLPDKLETLARHAQGLRIGRLRVHPLKRQIIWD